MLRGHQSPNRVSDPFRTAQQPTQTLPRRTLPPTGQASQAAWRWGPDSPPGLLKAGDPPNLGEMQNGKGLSCRTEVCSKGTVPTPACEASGDPEPPHSGHILTNWGWRAQASRSLKTHPSEADTRRSGGEGTFNC